MKAIQLRSIFTLLLILIYSNTTIAQQFPLRDVIALNLPPKFTKATKEQLQSSMLLKAKGSIINGDYGETFEIKGMFLQLNGGIGEFKSNRLEESQKTMREMDYLTTPEFYRSKIMSYNNYKVLVINSEYEGREIGKILMYCLSNDNKKVLSGTLEYKKGERKKACRMIGKVLKGITFK